MPVTQTVFARGSSGSGGNEINSQNTNTVPVTELRFEAAPGGDILLEYNGGNSDPDTILFVDGVETTFTVILTGTLPNSNKFRDVNGEDLRGEPIVVIEDDNTGQQYYFLDDRIVSAETMADLPNGSIALGNSNNAPPPIAICFCSGTLIDTPDGPRAIETLSPGELVLTDQGPLPVRWIGHRQVQTSEMAQYSELRPVCIAKGAIGDGLPSADVMVSANHRVQISGWAVELAMGQESALIAAKHLTDRPGIDTVMPDHAVTYIHLLFDSHRLVTTSGLISESFAPGPVGLATLNPRDREIVDQIALSPSPAEAPRLSLRQHEARALPALA